MKEGIKRHACTFRHACLHLLLDKQCTFRFLFVLYIGIVFFGTAKILLYVLFKLWRKTLHLQRRLLSYAGIALQLLPVLVTRDVKLT